MSQNIYDDPDFFEGYSQLPRSQRGLAGAPEWPSMRALLPDLEGRRVLDLGCGYGWFCRWAAEHGAASVLGIDLSERMLERARTATSDSAIEYRRADLEELERSDLGTQPFDLAYSSLAFHYIADFERLLGVVRDALVPAGRLVCSIEHPIYMAPREPGWVRNAEGRVSWPVDSYHIEGARDAEWLGSPVRKYHRTIGTTLNTLIRLGFVIDHVREFGPDEAQVAVQPDLAAELERPGFLLLAAHR